jgi:hypothetical protein
MVFELQMYRFVQYMNDKNKAEIISKKVEDLQKEK